jgi:hypothetical protein
MGEGPWERERARREKWWSGIASGDVDSGSRQLLKESHGDAIAPVERPVVGEERSAAGACGGGQMNRIRELQPCLGSHIAAYSFVHAQNHDPLRRRKLLIHAREVRKLRPQVEQKGLTLVPLRIYFNERGIAKVAIALCRGKTLGDKRRTLQTREHKREMDRALHRKHR